MQWSKATYAYGTAICLLELGSPEGREEATRLMREVPDLRQKIAGKSIPLEVRSLPFPDAHSHSPRCPEIRRTQSAQVHRARRPAHARGPRVRVHLPRDRACAAGRHPDAHAAAGRRGARAPRRVRRQPQRVRGRARLLGRPVPRALPAGHLSALHRVSGAWRRSRVGSRGADGCGRIRTLSLTGPTSPSRSRRTRRRGRRLRLRRT